MNELANFEFELCKLYFARREQVIRRKCFVASDRPIALFPTFELSTAVTNFPVFLPEDALGVISVDLE